MKNALLVLSCIAVFPLPAEAADLPNDEAGAIAHLTARGVTITRDDAGHAVRLMSSGTPALSVDEYQLIGLLTHLEQIGLNAAPLDDSEWGFLKKLPRLRTLSIWHGKGFATLEPFSKLPVESLTIGGCMGLRDLNKGDTDKLRNAITTLHDLPRLKSVNLYHSPLAPDDAHLAHLVKECPKLEHLRLDFAAPRGSETSITPEGLAVLAELPLEVLALENAGTFGLEHFHTIAKIESLRSVLVDARRTEAPTAGIATLRELRPDVEIVVAGPDAKAPPRATRR